jgi:glycosyltransferase involved in cell wall biosynthesis
LGEVPKINVLILSAAPLSGSFRMILDIVEYIDKSKFRVIIAHKPFFSEWVEESEALEKAGAKLVPLRGSGLFDVRGYWDLFNAILKGKVDILHCWDVMGIPARFVGKALGVKIVEEWANPPPKPASQMSYKHYYLNYWTSILVDGYIACSKGVMSRYIEKRPVILSNRKFIYIYNCLNTDTIWIAREDFASIRNRFGICENETVLTNVGYFNIQKAQTDLLFAFEAVCRDHKNVKLILVGWGDLGEKLKNLSQHLGISDRVIFTGKCIRSEVFEILSITDLFVMSSHWEGFGIVLAEAMGFGKPIIATDTDGAREVIENGKTGILTPIGDTEVLANTISTLLNNPDWMANMGRKGKERVLRLFNCKQFIRGYENFYQSFLKS